MAIVDVIVLDGMSLGRRVRLARVARGLRQLDLASMTQLQVQDISYVELDRPVHRWKMKRILAALELERVP